MFSAVIRTRSAVVLSSAAVVGSALSGLRSGAALVGGPFRGPSTAATAETGRICPLRRAQPVPQWVRLPHSFRSQSALAPQWVRS